MGLTTWLQSHILMRSLKLLLANLMAWIFITIFKACITLRKIFGRIPLMGNNILYTVFPRLIPLGYNYFHAKNQGYMYPNNATVRY